MRSFAYFVCMDGASAGYMGLLQAKGENAGIDIPSVVLEIEGIRYSPVLEFGVGCFGLSCGVRKTMPVDLAREMVRCYSRHQGN